MPVRVTPELSDIAGWTAAAAAADAAIARTGHDEWEVVLDVDGPGAPDADSEAGLHVWTMWPHEKELYLGAYCTATPPDPAAVTRYILTLIEAASPKKHGSTADTTNEE